MKQYSISYAEPAVDELNDAYFFIYQDSPLHADDWREKLIRAAESLKTSPKRCPLAPENEFSSIEVRQLIFGSYRILFMVEDDSVLILHIRHTARATMTADELRPPDAN